MRLGVRLPIRVINNTNRRGHCGVVHPSGDRRVVCILHGLVEARWSGVAPCLRGIHGGVRIPGQHMGRWHGQVRAEIVDAHSLVIRTGWLEDLGLSRAVVAVGADAVKLEADACRTRPGIGGGCIALDFPSTTSFTSSHDWKDSS